MTSSLVILTHVSTDAVNNGFLPAARALGLPVVLVTDQPEEHHRHFSQADLPAYPDEILGCDVFNPLAVIDLLAQRGKPRAVFSNSDHLQTVTALVADYFGLPGKDWRICYRAKNKAAMRAWSQERDVPAPWFRELATRDDLQEILREAPFPVVVKPREGVASRDVALVQNSEDLRAYGEQFWQRHPGQALLLEAYLEGPLFTLETLGDGQNFTVLGGFRVELSPPPYFVELRAEWQTAPDSGLLSAMAEQVRAFGVQFGACHTEFVLTADGPRLIEINYRSVGDGRELLLNRMLGFPLFETILRLHLGEPLPTLVPAPRHALIEYLVAPHGGHIMHAPAACTESVSTGELSFHPLRLAGERFELSQSNKDYLGMIKAFGEDAGELRARVASLAKTLLPAWEIA